MKAMDLDSLDWGAWEPQEPSADFAGQVIKTLVVGEAEPACELARLITAQRELERIARSVEHEPSPRESGDRFIFQPLTNDRGADLEYQRMRRKLRDPVGAGADAPTIFELGALVGEAAPREDPLLEESVDQLVDQSRMTRYEAELEYPRMRRRVP